jgi:hypothetical protein
MTEPIETQGPVAPPFIGLSVAGFVTSLLSFFWCPLATIAGLVISIIAWARASKEPARFGGKGLAIAGTVIGAIGVVSSPLLMIWMLLPALDQASGAANQLKCSTQMRAIVQGMIIYSQNHDDALPPADNWAQTLLDLGYIAPDMLVCPSADDHTVVSYHVVPMDQLLWDGNQVLMYPPGVRCIRAVKDSAAVWERPPIMSSILKPERSARRVKCKTGSAPTNWAETRIRRRTGPSE